MNDKKPLFHSKLKSDQIRIPEFFLLVIKKLESFYTNRELRVVIRAAIWGASGYTGVELIRILNRHPEVKITKIYSRSLAETALLDAYPGFHSGIDLVFEDPEKAAPDQICAENDVIFTALPHGAAMSVISGLFAHAQQEDTHIIDLSADFRYKDPQTYNSWYETEHIDPQLLSEASYGLPELFRTEIKTSRLVANPGCYPTASLLALAPIVSNNVIDPESPIIDAKSGVSGAGKKASQTTHFCNVHGNFKAYKVTNHRHASEIGEKLNMISKDPVTLSFTPHLVPMQRGILATIYSRPRKPLSTQPGAAEKYLTDIFQDQYRDEPFIKIFQNHLPETRDVFGTNFCAIGLRYDIQAERIIIIAAIDNLCKGASGQAVQNMNLLFGFDEETGLADSFLL